MSCTAAQILITEPTNYATADKILFSSGKASILGGTNAGDIEFATDKQVRLWGLVSSGDVKFTLSQDIVIGMPAYRSLLYEDQAAACHTSKSLTECLQHTAHESLLIVPAAGDVTNSGSIVMTGTKQAIVSVTNEAAGTVVGNGAGAYYAYKIVNKGAITINAVDALFKSTLH